MTDVWSFSNSLLLFAASTIIIGAAGWWITGVVDRLADQTGLGEALSGAIFLGASTSLSGIVTSVTTAYSGHAEFAISHAIGGIGIQTTFLAVADMTYRRANLEHAAASPANLMSGVLLIALLSLILLAAAGPDMTWFGIHPMTVVLLLAYGFGVRLIHQSHVKPLWIPKGTKETRPDLPAEPKRHFGLLPLWLSFIALAATVGVSGWIIARAAVSIVEHTGVSETLVGGLVTTFSTSLPELVTVLAAVHRGALTLAVGGIIGGNAFDTLLVALSDIAYRPGSVYHAAGENQFVLIGLGVLLTAVLLLGLLRREEHGIANIGFESVLILVVYVATWSLLVMGG
ncbi:MAG: cation transporter [Nitrospira sp. WS238]|nr:cation transporter [Nitrospira sp. WS238]